MAATTWDIIIVGGGLAGLTAALHLSRSNCRVLIVEKQRYPHHKVCGEYVSNETLPYLKSLGIDPFTVGATKISKFEISSRKGNTIHAELPLGGFGVSRYTLDHLLYKSLAHKVEIIFDSVQSIQFTEDLFEIKTKSKSFFKSKFVLGAFGKRSNIDAFLKRKFIQKPSPWLAVKGHYIYDFPEDKVALHNFKGGYCGLSKIESGAVNACYLTTFKSFKRYNDIDTFQNEVMSKNIHLNHFFNKATAVFKKPLTISQISFQQKKPVEDHIFMIGDSAGLIHPLCGNGMAMAIHSAKIFCDLFLKFFTEGNKSRLDLETAYTEARYKTFAKRLATGRMIQNLLLNESATKVGYGIARTFPQIVPQIIKKTHGSNYI